MGWVIFPTSGQHSDRSHANEVPVARGSTAKRLRLLTGRLPMALHSAQLVGAMLYTIVVCVGSGCWFTCHLA